MKHYIQFLIIASCFLIRNASGAVLDISGWTQEGAGGANQKVKITGVASGELPFFTGTPGSVTARKIITTDISDSSAIGRQLLSAANQAAVQAIVGYVPGASALTSTYIGYGSGSNTVTGESAFTYDASQNRLYVDNLQLGTARLGYSGVDVFSFTGGTGGEVLRLGLNGGNTSTISSPTGINNITFSGIDLTVPYEIYDSAGWNGDLTVPTKDAVRDAFESIVVGGASLNDTYVGFGDGSNILTGDGSFTYNSVTNTLNAPKIFAGSEFNIGNTDNMKLYSPVNGHISIEDSATTGDNLTFDLTTDNLARIYSLSNISSVTFDGIDVIVPTEAYDGTAWNGSNEVPTKDAVRDKFESFVNPIPATLIPYGDGSGEQTTEAAFSYDAALNILRAGSLLLAGDTIGWVSYGASTLSLESASLEKFTFDLATPNTMKFTTDSGINTVDFGSMGVKSAAAPTSTPTAMGALAVDLTKALNTKTISSNSVITFSGSLADGQYSELRLQNSGASEVTVSWAIDAYDGNTGELVSSITVPAADIGVNGRKHVVFSSDGTNMLVYTGGGSGGGTGDALLAGGNAFIGDQSVTGNMTVSGNITGTHVGNGSGLTDIAGSEINGPIADNTYETIRTAKAMIHDVTDAVSNVIVTTNAWTDMQADGASETVTYSGAPLEGASFGWIARDFVGDSLPTTFTIPSTFSQGLLSNRTSFSVPEGKFVTIIVDYLNGTYSMSGETVFISDLPAHASPTTSFLFETHDPTTGTSGKTSLAEAIAGTSIKTTRTGVRRTVYVNAGAMIPRTTNGAAAATVELATNDIMLDSMDFDTTTEEGVGFWFTFPTTYNSGTVSVRVHWTAASGTGNVKWDISARGYYNDDGIDQALGTEASVTDTFEGANIMHLPGTPATITIGGNVGPNSPVYFQIARDTATASNLSADAKLLGVTIEYTESETEPAAQ